jgi:hypothetical protein
MENTVSYCQECVFTAPLPSIGCPSIVAFACVAGMCLESRCLAMGIHITKIFPCIFFQLILRITLFKEINTFVHIECSLTYFE